MLLAAQFASAKTVDEVIEKYLRARGGRNKLASIKSIYMEGTMKSAGEERNVKIIKEKDKLSRTEIENGEANSFVLVTDKAAWMFFPPASPFVERVADKETAGWQLEMDIAGPLADYISKGHKTELLAKEVLEGNNCFKIKLTTKAGQELMFWVDASTYLLQQSSAIPIGGRRGIDIETFTVYRNYQEVDGIQFAYTQDIRTNPLDAGIMDGEILLHNILINPAIDPKMYQPE